MGRKQWIDRSILSDRIGTLSEVARVITLAERIVFAPTQVVPGQQEPKREAPPTSPSGPTVTAPEASQWPYVQAPVCHHGNRQDAGS